MKNTLRTLLIEDSDDDAELLLGELRRAGFEPDYERVQTGEGMRRALAEREWDIIICEYAMPSFNAPGAIAINGEPSQRLPIIIVSGTTGEDVAVETLKLGADDYLLKQNLTRLKSAVERALENASHRRQHLAIEETLQRNAQIFAQLGEAVICTDLEGRISYWNESATKLHGWTAAESLGLPISFLFPSEVEGGDQARVTAALQKGRFDGEIEALRKEGRIWIHLHITPLTNQGGEPIGFIGLGRDITVRRKRDEALRLRERALTEVSQGVLICDEKRLITYANAFFTTLTGYGKNELLGRSCAMLQGPDTDPTAVQNMRAALNAAQPFEGEVLNYRKDGRKFWNELTISPIPGHDGGPLNFVGIQRDVTARKEAEEQLRTTAERMQLAATAASAGIWELDLTTDQATWDEQMYVLFGRKSQPGHGGVERWFRSMHPEDIEKYNKVLDEVAQGTKDTFEVEFRIFRDNDGSQRLIHAAGIVKRDAAGKAVRMVGLNRDVTEERARELDLAKALAQEKELTRKARAGERAKSEFLAMMSHEIRTPMNGILGFAEILSHAPDLPVTCRDSVQTITSSAETLLRILDDILDFSRLEAGQLEIESIPFVPRELLQDVEMVLAPSAREKKLKLQFEEGPDIPPQLVGDPGRLRQILLNLVGNAIKFTSSGSVSVSLRHLPKHLWSDAHYYAFTVRDTGPGIPEEKLEAIFQPFVQADASISRRHGGTGLGLTIARRLVQLLDGTLTAQSESGKGAEFVLTLPFDLPKNHPEPLPAAEEQALDKSFAGRHPLRVMVVEDDKVNLKLISALSRRLGYEPLVARNGREALDIFRRDLPDCVFMDLQMPEMDGIEATEAIRRLEAETKAAPTYIVALTANILPADRQRCMSAGMNDYLNKPVKPGALAAALIQASELSSAKLLA